MAIASVTQKGSSIIAYNERGSQLCTVDGTYGELQGYTSTSFSVKRGSNIYVYGERGNVISTHTAR